MLLVVVINGRGGWFRGSEWEESLRVLGVSRLFRWRLTAAMARIWSPDYEKFDGGSNCL